MNTSPQAQPAAPGQEFPCSNCGAKLAYDAGAQAMKCPYCGAQQAIPQQPQQGRGGPPSGREIPIEEGLRLAARGFGTPVTQVSCRDCGASVKRNIAEGNGRFTPPDRCRFFDTARGSVLECAACLDLLAVKNVIDQKELADGKTMLERIVSMLIGLIRSNSADRLHETPISYRVKSKMD